MPADTFTTLLIGDVYSDSGIRVLFFKLNELKKKFRADFVIANGENATDGFGICKADMNKLFEIGVDVITSGNHIWQQEDTLSVLDSEDRLLRPCNYPSSVPGHGSVVYKGVGVINVQGRINMPSIDDPFKIASDAVRKIKSQTKLIFVDVHAESAEEKEALAYHLAGEVSCVVGTHTHVQSADERIIKNSTAFISDLGMTGPADGVIGSDVSVAIMRQETQMPAKAVPSDSPAKICGVAVTCDRQSGKALSIERFCV